METGASTWTRGKSAAGWEALEQLLSPHAEVAERERAEEEQTQVGDMGEWRGLRGRGVRKKGKSRGEESMKEKRRMGRRGEKERKLRKKTKGKGEARREPRPMASILPASLDEETVS